MTEELIDSFAWLWLIAKYHNEKLTYDDFFTIDITHIDDMGLKYQIRDREYIILLNETKVKQLLDEFKNSKELSIISRLFEIQRIYSGIGLEKITQTIIIDVFDLSIGYNENTETN